MEDTKRDTKIVNEKKKKGKGKKQKKKREDTHNIFKNCDIFSTKPKLRKKEEIQELNTKEM